MLQRLRAEMKIALASPELQARLNKAGGPGGHEHPDREVRAMIHSDYDKYGKVVRDVGIKLE